MSEKKSASKKSPLRDEPMVFPLGEGAKSPPSLIEEADFTAQVEPLSKPPIEQKSSWLGSLILGILSAILSLFVVEAIWQLVEQLNARSPLLGQAAFALALLLGVLLLFVVGRTLFSLLRLARVAQLRREALGVIEDPKPERVDRFAQRLIAFYEHDAPSAAGREKCRNMLADVHDPVILLATLERALLEDKDKTAQAAIAQAVQRVSVVTALSPRAMIDLIFVLGQSLMLIRTLCVLYGARASGLGLLRLAGRVAGHLAVTGGMGVAESMFGEVVGTSFAARLSAKFGEGVINGILTARIGIATVELVRPMPFTECEAIILSKVVNSLVFRKSVAENPADT